MNRVRLQRIWEDLRSSFWFIPGGMVVLAVAFSLLTNRIDHSGQVSFAILWGGGPEGAWEMLSTVAGSMVTVAGVTFSITMVVLSQAASQFGTQVLRNFMRNTQHQIVLGTFIATYVYSLLTLRSIRNGPDEVFVPHLSLFITTLLALASLGLLISFIHQVAVSIQAPQIIAEVADDMLKAIERAFPDPYLASEQPVRKPDPAWVEALEKQGRPIPAQSDGYLQAVDETRLMEIAARQDAALLVMYRPGQFIRQGAALVLVLAAQEMPEAEFHAIQRSFIIGRARTKTQDVEFAIDQLVEIAVRALGLGVNDPYPALTVVDWLGAALVRLAGRSLPQPVRYGPDGQPRLMIARPFTFAGVAERTFNLIRQKARDDVAVRIRLLEVMTAVAAHTHSPEDYEVLARQAEMVRKGSHNLIQYETDLADIDERYELVLRARPDFPPESQVGPA